jgi:Glycosyl hydrolase family 26
VSGGTRSGARITILACGMTLIASLAAGVVPEGAAADGPVDAADAMVTAGIAAAYGAEDAASQAMAASAADGTAELGRVASTVQLSLPPAAVQAVSGPSWTWTGWESGAAGTEAEDGSFGTWRGKPLGVVGVWCDTTAEAQTNLDAVAAYNNYDGDLDVAVGALVTGETWQQAAAGDFVGRWTTAMQNLRAMRQGKGTTYIRIAHEMNADWMPWGVSTANMAAYKAGYRLYASIVRKVFPQARLTWSPNGGNHSNATIEQLYPGDDVVDVIGPDIYDGWPDVTDAATWNAASMMWTDPSSPRGLGAWQIYAARKGKPIAMPEWGLPYGDHPAFIKGVHDTMAAHAAVSGSSRNAGRFVYDVYFNAEDKFKIYNGTLANSGAMYKSLVWGS